MFFKILENLQGDERVFFFWSFYYPRGPDAKMLMIFGLINRRGAEKGFKVFFCGPRHSMAVFSTFQAEAFRKVHKEGAAALGAFLHFPQGTGGGH
ncbi:hypothetical protein [Ralstonia solanacearum]|uniref:hypothetical protein n=1 Tax=Ralstonia solanacearum TaxID=305 RepID=UPI0011D27A96|nr:hypothetical protein [Ralstonia solanacearum]